MINGEKSLNMKGSYMILGLQRSFVKKNLTQNEQLLDFINNFHCYGRNESIFNRRSDRVDEEVIQFQL